jgi:hypothetical protein
MLSGQINGAFLITLLSIGGLGLGIGFSAQIPRLTSALPARYAPDMSGLIPTAAQLASVAGVAIFGTAYLSLAPRAGRHPAVHAFTIITGGFALASLLAAVAAYKSWHCPAAANERAEAIRLRPGSMAADEA